MAWMPRGFRPTRRDLLVACLTTVFVALWLRFDVSLDLVDGDEFLHVNHYSHGTGNSGSQLDAIGRPTIPNFLRSHTSKPKQIMPSTTIIGTAPGWTLFDNLYMSNGALLVISEEPPSSFPDPLMMTSTGKFD